MRKCLSVLAQKIALFGFIQFMKGAVPSFQAHSCYSNDAKIAAIYLVFTIHILRDSCKQYAIIIALFTISGVIDMEIDCLWLIFRVCGTQILPLLEPGV